MKTNKKYLLKDLSRSLLNKFLKTSQNFFIAKSFKKEQNLNIKTVTVCKFSVPLNLPKKNIHFLLNLFIFSNSKNMQHYIYPLLNDKYSDTEINIDVYKNIYPLLIKNNNLFFNNLKIYKSFLDYHSLMIFLLKFNISVVIIKYLKINYININ